MGWHLGPMKPRNLDFKCLAGFPCQQTVRVELKWLFKYLFDVHNPNGSYIIENTLSTYSKMTLQHNINFYQSHANNGIMTLAGSKMNQMTLNNISGRVCAVQ